MISDWVTVVGTGMTMSWAVLCTVLIRTKFHGSRTSILVDSPDDKLVRFWTTSQVIVKLLVAWVMTNVLVTNPLLLLLVLDMPQLEPSEQFQLMMRSPEPVAVQLKVAFLYEWYWSTVTLAGGSVILGWSKILHYSTIMNLLNICTHARIDSNTYL